jgi:hypothetical protein
MTNIDELTGLPELPKGYFWRVKMILNEFVVVQIRKRLLWGSCAIEEASLIRQDVGPQRIQAVAFLALDRWTRTRKDLGRYLGDYPPKKLP